MYQFARSQCVFGAGSDSYADRALYPLSLDKDVRLLFDGGANTFRKAVGVIFAGFWQHDHKFFPAITPDMIDITDTPLQHIRDTAKELIARRVTVSIVERLETVHVHHQNREGAIVARRTGEFRSQNLLHFAMIPESRQAVCRGGKVHLLANANIFEGDCDVWNQRGEAVKFLLNKRAMDRANTLHQTEQAIVDDDRIEHPCASGRFVEAAMRITGGVGDQARFQFGGGMTDQPFGKGSLNIEIIAHVRQTDLRHQKMLVLIHRPDQHSVGTHQVLSEAQKLFETAIPNSPWIGFTSSGTVVLYQNAGTAAGKAGNWAASAQHFLAGSQLANKDDDLISAFGLLADAAYATWQSGDKSIAVTCLGQAFDMIPSLPDPAAKLRMMLNGAIWQSDFQNPIGRVHLSKRTP